MTFSLCMRYELGFPIIFGKMENGGKINLACPMACRYFIILFIASETSRKKTSCPPASLFTRCQTERSNHFIALCSRYVKKRNQKCIYRLILKTCQGHVNVGVVASCG